MTKEEKRDRELQRYRDPTQEPEEIHDVSEGTTRVVPSSKIYGKRGLRF